MILHPMKSELNFPVGPRLALDFSPQRWLLPMHLLDAVFYAQSGRVTGHMFRQSSRATSILDRYAP